jgi:hypothetical protein
MAALPITIRSTAPIMSIAPRTAIARALSSATMGLAHRAIANASVAGKSRRAASKLAGARRLSILVRPTPTAKCAVRNGFATPRKFASDRPGAQATPIAPMPPDRNIIAKSIQEFA